MKTRYLLLVGLLLGASTTVCLAAPRLTKVELKREILLDKRDTLLAEINTLEAAIAAAAGTTERNDLEKRQADEAKLKTKKLDLAVIVSSLAETQAANAAATAGATADGKQAAKEAAIVAEVTRKAAEADDDDGVNAILRQNGVSLSVGGGVVGKGPDGGTVGTAIARWNMLQARTTKRHNQRPDLAKLSYSKVREGRAIGLLAWSPAESNDLRTTPDLVPFVTAVGPFIGRAIQGDTVLIGTKRERPWLLGASVGFGTYDQASSLFYVEAGYALSPTQGFSNAKGFIGLSFDAVVFSKITGLTKAPTGSAGK